MTGDKQAVAGVGSGRVLIRNPEQNVFFAYADHGSPGVLGFPTGPPLYADELNKVVIQMTTQSIFREMVMYVESCYGGSMFQGLDIERAANVLAVTAASSYENAYAVYCPSSLFEFFLPWVTPAKIGSCMGDRFTVAWLEDTEAFDIRRRSLKDQLSQVFVETSGMGKYRKGSHVTSYGDISHTIVQQMVANFMSAASNTFKRVSNLNINKWKANWKGYKQTDADLVYLKHQASIISSRRRMRRRDSNDAVMDLKQELEMRQSIDQAIYNSLNKLVQSGDLVSNSSVSQLAEELIPNTVLPNKPIVNNWDCLREMVAVWQQKCGKLNTYSSQYTRTFVNLCNAFVAPSTFKAVLNC
eukprot:g4413.t1